LGARVTGRAIAEDGSAFWMKVLGVNAVRAVVLLICVRRYGSRVKRITAAWCVFLSFSLW
jgi:hypothetical protein